MFVELSMIIMFMWRKWGGKVGRLRRWRRWLFAWKEEHLVDCASILDNIFLKDNITDIYIWKYDHVEGVIFLWNNTMIFKVMSLKVSILAWRTNYKSISTKEKLIYRGVCPSDFVLCSGTCGTKETINHKFLECDFFGSIYHLIHRWLGISTVVPSNIRC
jgi:hypothetical protein